MPANKTPNKKSNIVLLSIYILTYIAPLQGNYSETLPAQAQPKRRVLRRVRVTITIVTIRVNYYCYYLPRTHFFAKHVYWFSQQVAPVFNALSNGNQRRNCTSYTAVRNRQEGIERKQQIQWKTESFTKIWESILSCHQSSYITDMKISSYGSKFTWLTEYHEVYKPSGHIFTRALKTASVWTQALKWTNCLCIRIYIRLIISINGIRDNQINCILACNTVKCRPSTILIQVLIANS